MGELILAFITLTVLEIVLGIDNIVFISILVGKLPKEEQSKARLIGLAVAMIARVGLLLSISFVMGLTATLFNVAGQEISGRDLILILGGLFLHERFDDTKHKSQGTEAKRKSFVAVILQILVIDIVFSLDSVITAIGMSNDIGIMVAAVIIAVIFMMIFANKISIFIAKHHSVKILALAFLVLIGVLLVAEGFDQHIPKGYVYFAMAFSVGVEMINLRLDRKSGFVAPEPKE
jgi:predicted tellurium resistance membrane protein TerC